MACQVLELSQASTDVKDWVKQMVLNKTTFVVRTVTAWRLSCSEAHLPKKLVPWKTKSRGTDFAAEPTIHVQNVRNNTTGIDFLDDFDFLNWFLQQIKGFRKLSNHLYVVNRVKLAI